MVSRQFDGPLSTSKCMANVNQAIQSRFWRRFEGRGFIRQAD